MPVMPIIAHMTALEVARRSSSPDAFTIIETLAMTNTMLQELPVKEANDATVHTSLRRLSYPGGERRIYNQGVGKRSSQTEQVKDMITMLEAYCDVDVALAQHSGNPKGLYNSEASAFLAGMGLDQAGSLVYDNHAGNPAELDGLAVRYAKVDGVHCVDAGGRSTEADLTSIYLAAAGPNSFHLIYPKGSSTVGVQRKDAGEMYVKDPKDETGTKEFLAHRDHFKAEYGLVVAHPDAVIRICNVKPNMNKDERADLIELILRHQKRLTKGVVNTVLFCNQDIIYQIERAGRDAQHVIHPETDVWGKPVSMINGMRLREQDAILSAEEQVA